MDELRMTVRIISYVYLKTMMIGGTLQSDTPHNAASTSSRAPSREPTGNKFALQHRFHSGSLGVSSPA